MSEKTILEEIGEWWHNFWHGQPEQTQHEGTSTADDAGATTEVAEGGGFVEDPKVDVEERSTETTAPADSGNRTLPRTRGTTEVS
jgi:hypothetical protein